MQGSEERKERETERERERWREKAEQRKCKTGAGSLSLMHAIAKCQEKLLTRRKYENWTPKADGLRLLLP